MQLSPTQKLVAPGVNEVIKTAQDTIDASIKVRKANQKAILKARKLLNESILMISSGPDSDRKIALEKLQAVLRLVALVR